MECRVCGAFTPWRPGGHAEWCERVKKIMREDEVILNARHAGYDPTRLTSWERRG